MSIYMNLQSAAKEEAYKSAAAQLSLTDKPLSAAAASLSLSPLLLPRD
jgi:hypothetical protein